MLSPREKEIREAAEADLYTFIRLVAPHRVLGDMHKELFQWWEREEALDNQMALIPRDHQKSAMVAYRVAWYITKNPALTILYISATSGLAEKQLYFIKNIFDSKIYRKYWPDMFHPEEGKREKWASNEICTDHPLRKKEGVRDSTIMTAGLTTNITGFHFNIAVLDDVVIKENAYSQEGRNKVALLYSLLSSVETTDAKEWVVGTRYHPLDLYNDLLEMEEEHFSQEGTLEGTRKVYEVFERVLEDSLDRDGTGQYCWPRQRRYDGRHFGFDIHQRARKKAKYLDQAQFYAQYYNDPSDPTNLKLDPNRFQYYDKKHLSQDHGFWYFKDRKLNVFAAIDFAFSKAIKADYTAIVTIGIDEDNNVYVLDIDRFKTDRIREMFDRTLLMFNRWGFRKLCAEVSVAQITIVNEFKNYMRQFGVFFTIEEDKPTRHEGRKEERIDSILLPRYENQAIFHYRGGNCQLLEDELIHSAPEHDDIKDALSAAVKIARAPHRRRLTSQEDDVVIFHPRFGGVSF